jgi:hypothetical protein
MQRQKMFVSPEGSAWKVQWQGGVVATRTRTQDEAIREARRIIGMYPFGTCSQILVQKPNGQFRIEWTYGIDPFPPRG